MRTRRAMKRDDRGSLLQFAADLDVARIVLDANDFGFGEARVYRV